MTDRPTPRREWVKPGERCVSPAGWLGTVERVRADLNPPIARVRWDRTGSVGRHLITTLTRTYRAPVGTEWKWNTNGSRFWARRDSGGHYSTPRWTLHTTRPDVPFAPRERGRASLCGQAWFWPGSPGTLKEEDVPQGVKHECKTCKRLATSTK